MCETAVSQKLELLARMESVLVGSVKMSEWGESPTLAEPYISSAQGARQ